MNAIRLQYIDRVHGLCLCPRESPIPNEIGYMFRKYILDVENNDIYISRAWYCTSSFISSVGHASYGVMKT
jgi:hypothetical protein